METVQRDFFFYCYWRKTSAKKIGWVEGWKKCETKKEKDQDRISGWMEGNKDGQKERWQEVWEEGAQDLRWIERWNKCDRNRKPFRGEETIWRQKIEEWMMCEGGRDEYGKEWQTEAKNRRQKEKANKGKRWEPISKIRSYCSQSQNIAKLLVAIKKCFCIYYIYHYKYKIYPTIGTLQGKEHFLFISNYQAALLRNFNDWWDMTLYYFR